GGAKQRPAQYESECFFTICNYEQVLRDILAIERARWNLIVLDEGQRIKNWEAKTTQTMKSLRSPFALVLSGTPLENRLDDLFSEWTTMLTLIERQIKRFKLDYVRLDGSVPQKKRQQLVHQFQRDPGCRLFLTTNAGSTGLNLQAANTVINVDLPWNPAVL